MNLPACPAGRHGLTRLGHRGVAVAKMDSRLHGNDKSGVSCPRRRASKSKCEEEIFENFKNSPCDPVCHDRGILASLKYELRCVPGHYLSLSLPARPALFGRDLIGQSSHSWMLRSSRSMTPGRPRNLP